MRINSDKQLNLKMVRVILIVLFAIGSIIGVIILLFVKLEENKKAEEMETKMRETELVESLKNHLENKYGKKFIINPEGSSDGGSFIPAKKNENMKVYYEAFTEDDPDFIFRVYVEIGPKTKISDNYCWKFLREKLRNKIINELDMLSKEDYKLTIKMYADTTFNDDITPESSIEDYLRGEFNRPSIFINLLTYKSDYGIETSAKEKINKILNQLIENSSWSMVYFTYYVTKDINDYNAINVAEEEKSIFIIFENRIKKSYIPIKSMELEKKFKVTDVSKELNYENRKEE